MKSEKYFILTEFSLKDVSSFWLLKLNAAETSILSLHTISDAFLHYYLKLHFASLFYK